MILNPHQAAHRHTPKWNISLLGPILAHLLKIVDLVQAAVRLSMQLGNILIRHTLDLSIKMCFPKLVCTQPAPAQVRTTSDVNICLADYQLFVANRRDFLSMLIHKYHPTVTGNRRANQLRHEDEQTYRYNVSLQSGLEFLRMGVSSILRSTFVQLG